MYMVVYKIMVFGSDQITIRHNVAWHQDGKYPYQELFGGDGRKFIRLIM